MKRYAVFGMVGPRMIEDKDGDYVRYSDVDTLTASAPEMLEALKLLRSEMSSQCTTDGCTCGDGWRHDDPEVIAKVDAVIAKAEGREPCLQS